MEKVEKGGPHGQSEQSDQSDQQSGPDGQLEGTKSRATELKELKAKIQHLKKMAQSKQAKKEAQIEIARLEQEFNSRHVPIEAQVVETAQTAVESTTSVQVVSKQQKRKMKREAEIERIREEAREEALNQVDYRKLENDEISLKLKELKFDIYEISADGHCLYKAISHQLSLFDLGDGDTMDYKRVRKLTADYLRLHQDDFIPFLTSTSSSGVGDMTMSQSEYADYCDKVENSAEWGGHIEVS